jgi:hypothetical protein
MIKKTYIKPSMEVVKILQQCQILAGSEPDIDIEEELIDDEVPFGW